MDVDDDNDNSEPSSALLFLFLPTEVTTTAAIIASNAMQATNKYDFLYLLGLTWPGYTLSSTAARSTAISSSISTGGLSSLVGWSSTSFKPVVVSSCIDTSSFPASTCSSTMIGEKS